MKQLVRSALSVLAAIASSPAVAQDDFQQWLTLTAKADLSDRLVIQDELITRFSDDRDGLYEIENSLLLGYKLTDKVTAWAGYVHNPNYSAGNFTVMERRAREQLTMDNIAKLGTLSLSARLRFEQRWRDGIDGTAWRLRPYVKLGLPLGGKSAPALNLSVEPFINLDGASFQSVDGLERMRSSATLSFPVSKMVKMEAGYLNQRRFVRDGPDTNDHALTASLAFSF